MLREGENKIDWVRGFGRSRLEKKIGGIVSVCRVCYQHMVSRGAVSRVGVSCDVSVPVRFRQAYGAVVSAKKPCR